MELDRILDDINKQLNDTQQTLSIVYHQIYDTIRLTENIRYEPIEAYEIIHELERVIEHARTLLFSAGDSVHLAITTIYRIEGDWIKSDDQADALNELLGYCQTLLVQLQQVDSVLVRSLFQLDNPLNLDEGDFIYARSVIQDMLLTLRNIQF